LTRAGLRLDAIRVPKSRPSLRSLAAVIARDSNLTFGGGTATVEVLRRVLSRRGWQSDDEHRQLYAVSRLTPGTNLLAYTTGVGWQARGLGGAIAAWLASSLPASMIAVVAAITYESLSKSRAFSAVVLIGTAVAILLLLASAWHLAKPHLTGRTAMRSGVVAATALALSITDITPSVILLVAASVGATWPSANG
jgi:chromate transporter